ncbi:MAG: HEAT repeat domain-containing protein, partial [Elusimicrobiota bacterium]
MLLHAFVCSFALAASTDRPQSSAKLQEARWVLDRGLWNGRIQALYDLGELGRDALPLLAYSSDDADWQVRLTAVHFLGKIGPAAAPALADIVRVEPCPHVRISALRWLSAIGRPERSGTARTGKPLVVDAPGGMSAEFFNGGIDRRICASSEHAGRLKRHRTGPSRADTSEVATPPVPAAKKFPASTVRVEASRPAPETAEQRRLHSELDALLSGSTPAHSVVSAPRRAPESMPESPLLPAGAAPVSPEGRF